MLSRVLLQVLRNSLTALLHSNEPCCFRLPHHQTLFAAGDSAAPDNVTSASAAAAQQLTCGCKLRQNLDTSAISRLNEVTTTRFFQPGSLDIQQCSAAAEVSSCSRPIHRIFRTGVLTEFPFLLSVSSYETPDRVFCRVIPYYYLQCRDSRAVPLLETIVHVSSLEDVEHRPLAELAELDSENQVNPSSYPYNIYTRFQQGRGPRRGPIEYCENCRDFSLRPLISTLSAGGHRQGDRRAAAAAAPGGLDGGRGGQLLRGLHPLQRDRGAVRRRARRRRQEESQRLPRRRSGELQLQVCNFDFNVLIFAIYREGVYQG